MFNAVCTSCVPGINAGEVGGLYATSSKVAVTQYSVAVGPRYPFASPRANSSITVS